MNIKQRKIKQKLGYTLIEVIIVLTITSIAFVAIYSLFAKSMQSDAESRYEIVAASLAQEGVEIIKNKREKNEMDWAMWKRSDGVPSSSFKGISGLLGCNPLLDLTMLNYTFSCGNGADLNMQYNKSTLSRKYEAGCVGTDCVGPIFRRVCNTTMIDTTANGILDSLRVHCEVAWKSFLLGGVERLVKTEIVLTDWQR
jgi:prepilin-type N-terminal cleavage/methylation domain-containing protein